LLAENNANITWLTPNVIKNRGQVTAQVRVWMYGAIMLLEYILYLIFLYILIESYVYLKGPDELKITQLNLTGNNGSRDKQRVQPEKYKTRLQPGRGAAL
jgi:hypothetical protein